MGIGDAEGILRVIGAGIDMFDCVLPTRTARTGSALTATGRLNLRNARFARDPRPLEEGCTCPACARFSRAYVRHLVNQEELLGLRLLSLHNLHFLLELTAGARAAIERGELEALHGGGARPARRRPTGGPLAQLIVIVAMFALLWLFLIAPQRTARAGPAASCSTSVEVGDEILTVGGLYGHVRAIDEDDDLEVEIAPGTEVRIARRAVAAVVPPEETSAGLEDGEAVEAGRGSPQLTYPAASVNRRPHLPSLH